MINAKKCKIAKTQLGFLCTETHPKTRAIGFLLITTLVGTGAGRGNVVSGLKKCKSSKISSHYPNASSVREPVGAAMLGLTFIGRLCY